MRLVRNTLSVLSLVVLFLCSTVVARAETLDAIADMETPYFVFHLEDVGTTAQRLIESEFSDIMLGDIDEKDGIAEWLASLPLASVSLAGNPEGAHGGIAFLEGADRALEILDLMVEGEEVDGEQIAELFGLPDDEPLRENFAFAVEMPADGLYVIETDTSGILYELLGDWKFFASVEVGPNGPLLLVGSSPEQVETARRAFAHGDALEFDRRTDGDSFMLVADDDEGFISVALAEEFDIQLEPKAPFSLELSLGLPEDGIELSLRHNLLEVLTGDASGLDVPELDASGLKFGGGAPFFSAVGALPLTGETAFEILKVLVDADDEEDEEELAEGLESEGIDLDELASAARFFGAVIGGHGAIGTEYAPGGYAFVSGDPKSMKALAPLFEKLIGLSPVLERVKRKGWDIFFTPNEEYQEENPMPVFAGLRKGVLMAGVIDYEELETDPDIAWDEDCDSGPGTLLLAKLDMESLRSTLINCLTPGFMAGLEEAGVDTEDIIDAMEDSFLASLVRSTLEVGNVTLRVDAEGGVDLRLETREVDDRMARSLDRAIKKLAGSR